MIVKIFPHLMKNPQIPRNSKYANIEIHEKKINSNKHIEDAKKKKKTENQKSNREKRIIT